MKSDALKVAEKRGQQKKMMGWLTSRARCAKLGRTLIKELRETSLTVVLRVSARRYALVILETMIRRRR